MAVRFLHVADLHLGSPLAIGNSGDTQDADLPHTATLVAFDRIIEVAEREQVDFLAIAGDLFDEATRSVEIYEFLIDRIERLGDSNIPTYIVHGNHDPLTAHVERLSWPDAAHVFSSETTECIAYPSIDQPHVRLYGRSYSHQWESARLHEEYNLNDPTVPSIGLLHTDLDPESSRYAPCSRSELAEQGLDYWALGHVHSPEIYPDVPAAYPGIPQGRNRQEAPVGGCFLVSLELDRSLAWNFIPISPIVWRTITIDISESDSNLETLTDLIEEITDRSTALQGMSYQDLSGRDIEYDLSICPFDPLGFALRIEITGRGSLTKQLDRESLVWLQGRLHTELQGYTRPIWIESIHDGTGPPLPPLSTLRQDNATIDTFLQIVQDHRTDPDIRRSLIEVAGDVWNETSPSEQEDVPPTQIPLTPDRLDDLIDRSIHLVIERLVEDEYDVD